MDFTILRIHRKAKGLKLKEIAPGLGISSGYLSMIERNKKSPNIKVIEDICTELDCELRIIPKAQYMITLEEEYNEWYDKLPESERRLIERHERRMKKISQEFMKGQRKREQEIYKGMIKMNITELDSDINYSKDRIIPKT